MIADSRRKVDRVCAPTVALAMATAAAGCGGGAALLHGAHTLPEGRTAFGAGLTGTFTAGGTRSAIADAGSTPADTGAYAQGAAAIAGIKPGVAPWLGARVGLAPAAEAGITYTGRGARVDGRYAIISRDRWALSVGVGGSFVLPRVSGDASDQLQGLRLDGERGWGGDVPILIGWRSDSEVVSLWAGPRAGYERLTGTVSLGAVSPAPTGDLTLDHWYAGGVVGLTVGFRHLHAALELDAYEHGVRGNVAASKADVQGVTVAPAAALVSTF